MLTTLPLKRPYFFCGVGGSGMLPLALILRAKGFHVEGSDRALDQGRTAPKFEFLKSRGIALHAQDGSGLTSPEQILVTSAAVEETVPDVVAARRLAIPMIRRAELLAELFNAAEQGIGVGGTSGKSTVTGMIGWILASAGADPTIMNGAVMKNFITGETPFASARTGRGPAFVSEVDESDGSIALYHPRIAVITNISLDHKSMDELRRLFGGFAGRAEQVILNLDNEETASLARQLPAERVRGFSLADRPAALSAVNIRPAPDGVRFDLARPESAGPVAAELGVPGAHNVANALAALLAAEAAGVPIEKGAAALARFTGIKRRFEIVGSRRGITVIDDFAHNPDKLQATLRTLADFPGRLILFFQPHGFGPLRLMKDIFIETFAREMRPSDILLMPEPVYFGGTVDRSVTSRDITEGVAARGRRAEALKDRAAAKPTILAEAASGDRIVVMGARDDTLSEFAAEILDAI